MKPLLSVTVQNYNHAALLPRCLESIVSQSVQPFEILVLDDCSTDNSVEVIESFVRKYPHMRLHRNQRNLGAVGNVNHAIDLARGDYVFSSAADDELSPGFLEKSLAILERHPEAGLSCTVGDWREVATGLNWHMGVGMADTPKYLSPQDMVKLEKKGRLYIPGHSVIFKRTALLEAGKFLPELKYAVDWYADYVVGFRYGICVVPEPLAVFNIQPESYYKRTQRDPATCREVLSQMMSRLMQPQNQGVAELIRQGGSLYIFSMPILKLLLREQRYRRFITFSFLRKNLWHSTKLFLKRFTPAAVGNLYFKLAGYRAASRQPTQCASTK
jgi:glycosyltransferase involved in cell wall biosynthesis